MIVQIGGAIQTVLLQKFNTIFLLFNQFKQLCKVYVAQHFKLFGFGF